LPSKWEKGGKQVWEGVLINAERRGLESCGRGRALLSVEWTGKKEKMAGLRKKDRRARRSRKPLWGKMKKEKEFRDTRLAEGVQKIERRKNRCPFPARRAIDAFSLAYHKRGARKTPCDRTRERKKRADRENPKRPEGELSQAREKTEKSLSNGVGRKRLEIPLPGRKGSII